VNIVGRRTTKFNPRARSEIIEHGVVYTVDISTRTDLDRQLVKSATCTVTVPELELTIPAQRGQLTTVEGILRTVMTDLEVYQPLRKLQDEPSYLKIQALINKIKDIVADDDEEDATNSAEVKEKPENLSIPFTIMLDDPSGDSFLEFLGSMSDPKWTFRQYNRTRQQNIDLGYSVAEDGEEAQNAGGVPAVNVPEGFTEQEKFNENEEVFVFPGTCSSCGAHLDTMMKKVSIPYFKDILIMSTNCDKCGYRDNEVKSGSAISELGKRITLKVEDKEDLSRDILKSESCGLHIPEIDLVLQAGTLGGRFTTVEGILDQIYDELSNKLLSIGDSTSDEDRKNHDKFIEELRAVKNADRPFTLILEDPLANSYLQNLYAPDPDPNMTIESFERTWEQNEDLGLNDIKVEGYEADEAATDKTEAQ